MRNHQKLIASIVCLTVVAALLAVFARGQKTASSPLNVASVANPGARVRWPESRRFTYSLIWNARTAGEVAPGDKSTTSTQLNLEASIEGEIALQRAGGTDAAQVVALSYTRFDKFSFAMQGQDAKGQAAQINQALAGQTAFLTIDDRGRISSVAFPPEMEAAPRSVLRSLAMQLGYTLSAGDETSWETDESDSLGEAHVRYRRGAAVLAREPLAFTRLDVIQGELDGKQAVRGGALIGLDGDGLPLTIDETVDATYTHLDSTAPALHSGWSFKLARLTAQPSELKLAAAAQRAVGQPLHSLIADPDRDRRRDTRLAAQLTTNDLLEMFGRFESGTRLKDEFLVRAAAYLRLHPEAMPQVLAQFRSPDLSVRGRGLILDVLASTGNAQAQEAMRAALDSPQARAKPGDHSILIQRFSFVLQPDAASVQFLEKGYAADQRGGDVSSAQGTAVALGAMVRRLASSNPGAANEVNERLRSELREASTPEMRSALVAALGNTARADDVADIAAFAKDAQPNVRNQVAGALSSVDSPEARQTLLSLAADANTGVAIAAFDSLRGQSLGDAEWQSLQQIAQDGSSPVSSDATLLNLVREKDKSIARPEAKQILTSMLLRNRGGDNDLPGIIRGLLSAAN